MRVELLVSHESQAKRPPPTSTLETTPPRRPCEVAGVAQRASDPEPAAKRTVSTSGAAPRRKPPQFPMVCRQTASAVRGTAAVLWSCERTGGEQKLGPSH